MLKFAGEVKLDGHSYISFNYNNDLVFIREEYTHRTFNRSYMDERNLVYGNYVREINGEYYAETIIRCNCTHILPQTLEFITRGTIESELLLFASYFKRSGTIETWCQERVEESCTLVTSFESPFLSRVHGDLHEDEFIKHRTILTKLNIGDK